MKTRIRHEKGLIKLVIDDPKKTKKDQDVLAAMSQYEGTPCWKLMDVRLTRFFKPNPFMDSLPGEAYCATFKPENQEDADFAKSLLREYQELPDGTLLWGTFDGVVRGAPDIDGYRPPRWANFHQSGYFKRADALDKLKEIQEFWDNTESLDSDWRIKNPHRQPSVSDMMYAVRNHDDSFILEAMTEERCG